MMAKINNIKYLTVTILVIVNAFCLNAQPNLSTKKVFGSLTVYQDYKIKNLFYYAPGRIFLGKEINGKPKFSLLSMRYTGSSATGNSGEKRFTNLIQFTVQLENPSAEILKLAKQSLGSSNVQLRPFPIKSIENNLVAFFNNQEKEIAKSSNILEEKVGNSESYWTERTLNFRLSNEDAQLLMDQIEQKKCAISFNYAFWGDCLNGIDGTVSLTGSKKKIPIDLSSEVVKDTLVKTQVVSSDVLQLDLDFEKYPEVIKKIDLNEEVPPAYALLEARCYDFYDNLRPDLFMKTIEIQAVGVNGKTVILPAKRFVKNKPDIFSFQIQFPYAIRMYEPFKYRVTEYLVDGKRVENQWIEKKSFAELIDITTPLDLNVFEKKSLEFEIENDTFYKDSLSTLEIELAYIMNGKKFLKILKFEENLNAKTEIIIDKTQPFQYAILATNKLKENFKTEANDLTVNYLYIKPNEIFNNPK